MTIYRYRPKHPNASINGYVTKEEADQWDYNAELDKSSDNIACPMVIGDCMPETKHMADGQYYTSKAKFRKATRAAGCIEVGNDPAILRPKKVIVPDRQERRNDIRQAIQQLKK